MNKLFPLLALGFGAITAAQASDGCQHEADRSATLDAAGARKVVIGTGAGDLEIRGTSGQTQLRATGRACASSEELLGQIQLQSHRDGDTLYLKAVMPETNGFNFNHRATLDLKVTLPDSIAVELEDSSGDVELENVQSAIVSDNSGDLDVENVRGNLQIADSSGDLEVGRIGGNVTVTDSSGDIELQNIQGDVEIPVDSSGDIRITQAASVHIASDSSGGIRIQRVSRDVRIDTDSSGDITVEDVGGNFSVGSDGSGSIDHARVTGSVKVPAQ